MQRLDIGRARWVRFDSGAMLGFLINLSLQDQDAKDTIVTDTTTQETTKVELGES